MVIRIHCPSCPATFPVDPDKIPEAGVNARCSSCGHVFRVERPSSIDDLAPDVVPEVAAEPVPEPEPVPVPEPEPEPVPEPEPEPEPVPDFAVVAELEPEAEPVGTEPEEEITIVADFGAESQPEPKESATDSFFAGGAPAATEDPPAVEDAAEPAAVEDAAVEEAPAEEAPAVSGFSFGRRDPKDKAKRLARVLVSDMTMYNADLHETALAKGTLKEDFEEEIDKSWKEYVEQVGAEMAGTDGKEFWRQALNDVLAKGEEVF
ncbi:MAG: zinc-ribbon domain-containing protein [Gemmatimonadetes bacterium]|nr:zinc-ribbon domain-containing protein [Gemmatimonadota bacterium]